MVSLKALKRVKTAYIHKHCPDGIASAMIIADAYRMLERPVPLEIKFIAHNTAEHETAGLELCEDPGCEMGLFCDMTPTRKFIKLYGARPNFIVLDHHSKQRDIVEAFGDRGIFADVKTAPGVSGATLAFREVWEPINRAVGKHDFLLGKYPNWIHDFACNVGARDTWQKESPRFLPGSWTAQMLMSKPAEYWLNPRGTNEFGDPSAPEPFLYQAEVSQGKVLFETHEEAVKDAIKQAVVYDLGDAVVYVFQEHASGFRLTSDAAEAIRQNVGVQPKPKRGGVVAGFSYNVDTPGTDPVLVYSLRGLDGFDVGALATCNGGGGHDLAGGFSIPIRKSGAIVYQDPYETIRERVDRFLLTGDGWATPYKEKP
jgi:hypothetical protein